MIVRATLQRFRLPLRRPLATARGLVAAREGVLLELTSRSGARGFGEAMPLAGWPGEGLGAAEAALEKAAAGVLGRPCEDARLPVDCAAPLARAALASALLDLAAREAGVPLAEALAACPARARSP